MKNLSNVQIMLLHIIAEKGEVSGYEINKLLAERGYREWADIGQTSIYIGLEKLRQKALVRSYLSMKKRGKGPLPRKFKMTRRGTAVLKKEILRILSSTRERQRVFDLGLAAIPLLPIDDVTMALSKRKAFLLHAFDKVDGRFKFLGGEKLPFHTKTVFKHILFSIKHELKFMDFLIKDLKAEMNKKRSPGADHGREIDD